LLRERKPVVVMSESGATGVSWYRPGFDLTQDNPWRNPTIESFRCERYRGRPDSPLFLLNHWVSRQPPSVRDADRANSYDLLLAHARRCQAERGQMPNLLAVNFFDRGQLLPVVDALNGFPPGSG